MTDPQENTPSSSHLKASSEAPLLHMSSNCSRVSCDTSGPVSSILTGSVLGLLLQGQALLFQLNPLLERAGLHLLDECCKLKSSIVSIHVTNTSISKM